MLLVVAADLVGPDDRHLLHRRPLGKQHGGLWEYPGGKVEPGEDTRSALARELAEELGIAVLPSHLAPLQFADTAREINGSPIALLLYRCRQWAGIPEALEGGVVQWFTPSQMLALPMPPLDQSLTAAILGGEAR